MFLVGWTMMVVSWRDDYGEGGLMLVVGLVMGSAMVMIERNRKRRGQRKENMARNQGEWLEISRKELRF